MSLAVPRSASTEDNAFAEQFGSGAVGGSGWYASTGDAVRDVAVGGGVERSDRSHADVRYDSTSNAASRPSAPRAAYRSLAQRLRPRPHPSTSRRTPTQAAVRFLINFHVVSMFTDSTLRRPIAPIQEVLAPSGSGEGVVEMEEFRSSTESKQRSSGRQHRPISLIVVSLLTIFVEIQFKSL